MEEINQAINRVMQAHSTRATQKTMPSLTENSGGSFREMCQFDTMDDPILGEMVDESARFWGEVRAGGHGRWLSLCGESGTGKTHLARQLSVFAKRLCRLQAQGDVYIGPGSRLFDARFYSWPAVVQGMLKGEYGVLDEIKSEWFVVLDDIGTQRPRLQELSSEHLFEVLLEREGKWTVITSNMRYRGLAKIDVRIPDRMIRGRNKVVACKTNSYAVRKLKEAESKT